MTHRTENFNLLWNYNWWPDTEGETLVTGSLRNIDGLLSPVRIKRKVQFKAYMQTACSETEH